ncbi:MAG: tRNA lysidine(34) synthetase TilS [Bacteroidia bacterium]|nr:tRNA lysidine(34) synthetase TilS [Bacteroidia bacterium]
MLSDFKNYIQNFNLFEKNDNILLAVSGGIDSVVMLDLFIKAKYKCAVAHCNFLLREDESEQDEEFVRSLSKNYNLPFFTKKFHTEKYASQKGISVQMAARELRYAWFEKIRIRKGYDYIAAAHNQNDSIETFLLNITRGTGIKGLTGIAPKAEKIVRPILFATRENIITYCTENTLTYREDSSNYLLKYARNKIRHVVIPALKDINPGFEQTIPDTIQNINDAEKIYNSEIDKKKRQIVKPSGNHIYLNILKLKKLSPLATYLFEIIKEYNFNPHQVKDIISTMDSGSGKMIYSASHQLLKDRENLIIAPLNKNTKTIYKITENTKKLSNPVGLVFTKTSFEKEFKIPKTNETACLDYYKLKFPLILRKWHDGDFFYPLGMKGRKKISDFFIDNKISLIEKQNSWILVSDHKIVWLMGYRIDDRFRITKKTKRIYLIKKF